ncbi:hypothetical protein ACROYT_G016692 [Oculina patagonica]
MTFVLQTCSDEKLTKQTKHKLGLFRTIFSVEFEQRQRFLSLSVNPTGSETNKDFGLENQFLWRSLLLVLLPPQLFSWPLKFTVGHIIMHAPRRTRCVAISMINDRPTPIVAETNVADRTFALTLGITCAVHRRLSAVGTGHTTPLGRPAAKAKYNQPGGFFHPPVVEQLFMTARKRCVALDASHINRWVCRIQCAVEHTDTTQLRRNAAMEPT